MSAGRVCCIFGAPSQTGHLSESTVVVAASARSSCLTALPLACFQRRPGLPHVVVGGASQWGPMAYGMMQVYNCSSEKGIINTEGTVMRSGDVAGWGVPVGSRTPLPTEHLGAILS
jgi:hypothetical protein